jgi:DNA-binding CsgD family transcriptional regulator
VIDRLAARGETALVLRSGGPFAAVPHGALGLSPDPRAARLRDGRPAEGERPIVVIDDAHELDAASVAAVVRAVYGGHATALFALTVSRDGATRPVDGSLGASQMAIDLWLRGLADRVDLATLTPRDATQLLDLFASPDLDTLTRATIIALADGSRMLLRELATEASNALRHGRDPVEALRDSAPNGRLSDALGAHVAQLAPAERSALAVLGRLPRIGRADAVRFLPASVVDALVATRLLHDDGTPARRLTANAALAREAERRAGSASVDTVIAGAVTRMLDPSSEWWCEPLGVIAAQSWLHGAPLGPSLDEVAPAARARATLDAARRANTDGEPGFATAYAQLGLQSEENPRLRLELCYAEVMEGGPLDVEGLLKQLSAGPIDGETLLRFVRVAGLAEARGAGDISQATERIAALISPDARTAAELTLIRANLLGFSMDWASAATISESLFAGSGNSVSLRMRAATLAAFAYACLGSWENSQAWFLRAHRCAGERGGISPVTTAERLTAVSVETVAAAITGTALQPALARLGGEVDAAARQGDAETMALAGLILATTYAMLGETAQSARELRAAMRRVRPPATTGWVPFAQITVTRGLALSHHSEDAQALLDLIDPAPLEKVPALAHARVVAESYVAAALGRRDEALCAARTASRMSVPVKTLHARDLYQLIVLGEPDEAYSELGRLAAETDVPSIRSLWETAASLVESQEAARPGALDAMRRGAPWDRSDSPPASLNGPIGRASEPEGQSGVNPDLELTRREREIALLVAEGLGNREIAERLYLSVRTVESHVYQARAKLGVGSRAELGRIVAPAAKAEGAGRALLL